MKKENKLETNCRNCIHIEVCSYYEEVEAVILKRPGDNFRRNEAYKVYNALAKICKNYKFGRG